MATEKRHTRKPERPKRKKSRSWTKLRIRARVPEAKTAITCRRS